MRAPILVVDDQPANVALLEQMLHAAGRRVVDPDSREVYDLHRVHRYALILLDVQMPGLDGFEVMEALEGPRVLLAATCRSSSSRLQPNHKLRALKAGARDFV